MHELVQAQRSLGHEVETFASDSSGIAINTGPGSAGVFESVRSASNILFSTTAMRALKSTVARMRPDVVHFHSIYHQLSPSVLLAVPDDVPRVMTLHDFKLAAPCYGLFRDDAPCERCVGKPVPVDAVRLRCIKGSIAASTLCAVEQVIHRRTYKSNIDFFIAPSDFAADLLSRSPMVAPDAVRVVSHGIGHRLKNTLPSGSMHALFVGRLAREKAVQDLIKAWNSANVDGFRLQVIGDGPDRRALEDLANDSIEFTGWSSPDEVASAVSKARLVVVPSRFYETFGLVVAEALMAGTPVIASDSGALPEHVKRSLGGLTYQAGNVPSLIKVLSEVILDGDRLNDMGKAGRSYATSLLSIDRMTDEIFNVYEEARYLRSD